MAVDLTKYVQELEDVVCSACGSGDYEVLSNKERYNLPLRAVMCRTCSLIFINPRPVKRVYEKLNMADYRLAAVGHDGPDDRMFKRQREHMMKVTLPFIQKYADAHEIQSVLDVGCLYGGTMAGWLDFNSQAAVEGIEPVIKVAAYARNRLGAKVTTGIIENFQSEKKFGLVIFAQALNHTLDPKANLEKIRTLLDNDGYLFISLYDAVSALLNRPIDKMVEITHPYMFSRESIQYILLRAGFRIVGYEDKLLDAKYLDKKDVTGLSFPRIRVLAQRAETVDSKVNEPDYKMVLGRVNRNMEFYMRWADEIQKWYKPNIWRRIVKAVKNGI
jgi:SAM-dependent methyltransferase